MEIIKVITILCCSCCFCKRRYKRNGKVQTEHYCTYSTIHPLDAHGLASLNNHNATCGIGDLWPQLTQSYQSMAMLVSKVSQQEKKLPPVGLNLMITGSRVQCISYRANLVFACQSETFGSSSCHALLNYLSPKTGT